MQITINNTKTANFFMFLATSMLNKRDPMMNESLQYVYLKGQNDLLTIEAGDAEKKQRYVVKPEMAGIQIDEFGEMLIAESQILFAMGLPDGTVIKTEPVMDETGNGVMYYEGTIFYKNDNIDTETKFRFNEQNLDNFQHMKTVTASPVEMSIDNFCEAVKACAAVAGKEDNKTDDFHGRITVMKKGGNVVFSATPAYGPIMADYVAQASSYGTCPDFCASINSSSAKRLMANLRAFASLTNQDTVKIAENSSGLWLIAEGMELYTNIYADEKYVLDTSNLKAVFEADLKHSFDANFYDTVQMASRIIMMADGKCYVNMNVDNGKAEFRLINSESGLIFREAIPAATFGGMTDHNSRLECRTFANNLLNLPKADKVHIMYPDNDVSRKVLVTSGNMNLYMMEYVG